MKYSLPILSGCKSVGRQLALEARSRRFKSYHPDHKGFIMSIGSVVKLKSGSPDLTIIHIDGDMVTVEWDCHNGRMTHVFNIKSLKRI